MSFSVEYLPEALIDLKSLDGGQRARVLKAIEKVRTNPYPITGDAHGHRGYGKPLGSKRSYNLSGLLKIKLRQDGIRVVYKLACIEGTMTVIVIGMRTDEEVYRMAGSRREKHGL